MYKKFIFILVVALFTIPLQAQNNTTRFFFSYGYEAVTVADSAIGFTAAKITPPNVSYRAAMVSVKIECAASTPCDSRFTMDGTTVTTLVGTLLSDGDSFVIYGYENILAFRAIRTGADSASYRVNFYR